MLQAHPRIRPDTLPRHEASGAGCWRLGTVLVLVGALLGAGVVRAQPSENAPPAATVRFRGEPLFELRASAEGRTPAQRAASIEERIRALAGGSEAVVGQIHSQEVRGRSVLFAGGTVLVVFSDADAFGSGRSREALAAESAQRLREALARDFADRSSGPLARAVLLALGLTVLFLGLLYAVQRFMRRAVRRLNARLEARAPRQDELRSLIRVDKVLLGAMRLLRNALSLGLLVAWAVFVLGLFPWTRGLAREGFERMSAAAAWGVDAVADYLPNLVYITLAVLATRWVLRLLRLLAREVGTGRVNVPKFFPDWAEPTYKIARVLVLALSFVIIYPYLPGSGSPAFQGVSVFLGVLVSLGSTSAIANMIAGLVITYMRPFRLEDFIRIGDIEGKVIEKTLLVVRLRTLEGTEVTVPNSTLLQNALQNFSAPLRHDLGLVVEVSVSSGYDVPWRKVEGLLLDAARATPGIVEKPPPEVWQIGFEDFYVRHTLRVAVRDVERQLAILGTLRQAILERFAEAGVELLSPHFVAARDGNTTAIPPEQRPADYVPPAFRHEVFVSEESRTERGTGREAAPPAPERH